MRTAPSTWITNRIESLTAHERDGAVVCPDGSDSGGRQEQAGGSTEWRDGGAAHEYTAGRTAEASAARGRCAVDGALVNEGRCDAHMRRDAADVKSERGHEAQRHVLLIIITAVKTEMPHGHGATGKAPCGLDAHAA